MERLVTLAGQSLPASLAVREGALELTVGRRALRVGRDGRFCGSSERRGPGLRPLLEGAITAEQYVAGLKRDVDLGQALARLLGRPAAPALRELGFDLSGWRAG